MNKSINKSMNCSVNFSMNFSMFTEAVIKGLQEKLGEDFKISSNRVKKNNGIELTGIIVEEKNCNTSPAIYIDDFYENYQKGVSLEEIIEALYRIFYRTRFTESVDLSNFITYERAKEQIAFKVINYEKNRELLRDVPYKVFCNLAIVFYYTVQEPPFYGKASILIRNSHLHNWGIAFDELYEKAMVNTPAMFPPQIENIEAVMLEMLDKGMKKENGKQSMVPESTSEFAGDKWVDGLIRNLLEDIKNDADRIPMFVLSNKQKLLGAACMFYPNVLKAFAEEKNCDLYILPSSIHEVILLPATGENSKEDLYEMVAEINRTQVEDCEILADAVYFYKKNLDEIARIC